MSVPLTITHVEHVVLVVIMPGGGWSTDGSLEFLNISLCRVIYYFNDLN